MSVEEKSIFLTGFMGAGKTTVGRYLARKLRFRFLDLDKEIVKREGRSIAEIFAADGELYFRNCESQLLNDLAVTAPSVYATGGGIVQRDQNRLAMRQNGSVVYLRASWETLQDRLQNSKGRPLIDPERGWDDTRKLWQTRQSFYADADLIVDTDGLGPEAVAEKIFLLLARKSSDD